MLLLAILTSAVQAQAPSRRLLTVSLSLATRGDVWRLSPTYVHARGGQRDSFALARERIPAFALAVGLTRFVTRSLAWTADVGYVSAPTRASCDSLGPYSPDPEQLNYQACAGVSPHMRGGLLSLSGGLMLRPLVGSSMSPYVRASAGPSLLSGEFIDTHAWVSTSTCGLCLLLLLDEEPNSRVTWSAAAALGLHVRPEGSIGLRVEARDMVAWLPTPAAAPNAFDPNLRAPIRKRPRHIFMISVGAEIDLERRHQRRY